MNASLASASAAMSINDDKAIDNKNGRCFLMCIFPRVKLLNSRTERRPPGPDSPVPAYEYSLAEVPVKQRLGLQLELPGLDNRSTPKLWCSFSSESQLRTPRESDDPRRVRAPIGKAQASAMSGQRRSVAQVPPRAYCRAGFSRPRARGLAHGAAALYFRYCADARGDANPGGCPG